METPKTSLQEPVAGASAMLIAEVGDDCHKALVVTVGPRAQTR
jgi:hypothetical protein